MTFIGVEATLRLIALYRRQSVKLADTVGAIFFMLRVISITYARPAT
jgi:hypothetical protein